MSKQQSKQILTESRLKKSREIALTDKSCRSPEHGDSVENENIEIQALLDAVNLKYGYDLKHYSKAFLKRRLLRKLSFSEMSSISEMQHRVLEDVSFFESLLLDLSIPVTEMFRDHSFYLSLRKEVIPYLKTYPFIKVWHAGCATGEEVYSTAILFKEEGLNERTHFYATDFNEIVLNKAKSGIFPIESLKKYTSNYHKSGGAEEFADYYTADSKYVIMNRSLKKNITFASHNLITDGVFNEMNLILCRNVLIYFDKDLKNRAIGIFYESLSQNGLLCLGMKENLRFTEYSDYFRDVVEAQSIYSKKNRKLLKKNINAAMDNTIGFKDLNSGNTMKYEAVVIGVSTGGLNALDILLSSLPDDFTLPVIIVQHRRASSGNSLVQILSEKCRLKVKEAEDKEDIHGGVVYIAPPDYHLIIEVNRTFSLSLAEPCNYARPCIDMLFETAADTYKSKLAGIILTGANSDGSQGLKRIKDLNGFAIVQDPETAEAGTMPRSAMEVTAVDSVLTLQQIAQFLAGTGHTNER